MPPATSLPQTSYNILSELTHVQEAEFNETLLASLAFCYSWVYNRRRLEAHTYPAWEHVFSAFAAIDPCLISASQFPLYSGSPYGFDLSDSFRTVPDGNAQEGFPDLALLCARYRVRNLEIGDIPQYDLLPRVSNPLQLGSLPWAELPRWDELIVQYVGLPILLELKKYPSRTQVDKKAFATELEGHLEEATNQLEGYAKLLFADSLRYDQDSVILIAGSGEWYKWRVMTREQAGIEKPDKRPQVAFIEETDSSQSSEEEEEEEEEDEDEEYSEDFVVTQKKTRKGKKSPEEKAEARKKAQEETKAKQQRSERWKQAWEQSGDEPAPARFLDLDTNLLDRVVVNIDEVVPPEGFWSRFLRLGSDASNQRMWYLRNHLSSIVEKRDTVYTKG